MNKEISYYTNLHNYYFQNLKRCFLNGETKTKNLHETMEYNFVKNQEIYFLSGYNKIHDENELFFYNLNNLFMKNLYHLPSFNDYQKIVLEFGKDILKYIHSLDEYKYLQKQLIFFKKLGKNNNIQEKGKRNIKIKYYGPVGKSGYSKITRNIIKSLFENNIEIQFIPLQFHDFSSEVINNDDLLLSDLSYNNVESDFIVIHSIPECWPSISKYEKNINPNCKIYCISVWELEDLPLKFQKYIQYSDKISVPSNFSAISFKKHHDNVDIVHHPIYKNIYNKDEHCLLFDIKDKFDYIFYNISEWTNRKGITELIKVFTKINNPKILLYIKTYGDISEKEGKQFLRSINAKNVILDYKYVSDEYINCIHNCGNCYVSFAKSEGHGIGVCEAGLYGNHVITTNYGGFLDYLKNVDIVNFSYEPATFCTTWSTKHESCQNLPHCSNFDTFLPCLSKWALIDEDHALNLMIDTYTKKKKGNDETIKFLQENFNKEKFYKNFLSSILSTTKLQFNKTKICNSLLMYSNIIFYPQKKYFNWEPLKKIILISSASGMGNVGDQLINDNIVKFFSRNYNIINIPDNQIITNDYKKLNVCDYKNEEILDFDFFIYGGGGLFRENLNIKNSNLFFYSDFCNKNNKSFNILGCGFQDLEINHKDFKKYEKFSNVFRNANYVSVRSVLDYNIVKSLVTEKDFLKINWYPDIGYSNCIDLNFKNKIRDKIVIIPTKKWSHTNLNSVIKIINDNPKLKVYLINFGSQDDNDFQNCNIENYIINETKNIQEIFEILLETKILITGRYHGLILGRLSMVPLIETFNYNNFKFKAEEISKHDLLDVKKLSELSIKQLEECKKLFDNEIILNYQEWDNDKRNSKIVELNKINNLDICLIQNWNNYEIEKKILNL